MATIYRSTSLRVDARGMAQILLRLSLSMNIKLRVKSGVYIEPARLRDGRFVTSRLAGAELARIKAAENSLTQIETRLLDFVQGRKPENVTKEQLQQLVDQFHNPQPEPCDQPRAPRFFDLWALFIASRRLSENRVSAYRSAGRTLHRFELYRRITDTPEFTLDIDTLTAADLTAFENFLRDEWRLCDLYPEIYDQYPASLRPQHKTNRPEQRGNNVVACTLKRVRAFMNWCRLQDLTENRPFERFTGTTTEVYGTPFYLTIAERDQIADFDLSARPALAVQRDIFIFQCLVGCRVSDLARLTPANVVDGVLVYVPRKTRNETAAAVRVPLSSRAARIVERYKGADPKGRLLPCISDQRYNDAIKNICRLCGIDRIVTVVDPVDGTERQLPICTVATSHMARRTFIGNLYKKVRDPNLVGSLSGHCEGSRAFARYRQIDDDIKRDLIDLLEQ